MSDPTIATLEFRSGVIKTVDGALAKRNVLGLDCYGHIIVSNDPAAAHHPEVVDPLMVVLTSFPPEAASDLSDRQAATRVALREAVATVTTDLPTDTTTTYYDEGHATALVVTTREGEHAPYLIRIERHDNGEICTQSSTGSAWLCGWEA